MHNTHFLFIPFWEIKNIENFEGVINTDIRTRQVSDVLYTRFIQTGILWEGTPF